MKALLLVMLMACTAPPVKNGRCRADAYHEDKPQNLVCLWDNSIWRCPTRTQCSRTNEDPTAVFPPEKK